MARKYGSRAGAEARAATPVPALSARLVLATAALLVLSASLSAPADLAASPARQNISAPKAAPAPDLTLEAILEKAAEYSRKLESSTFDFVCREEISETIDPTLEANLKASNQALLKDTRQGGDFLGPTITLRSVRKIKRRYVYDYQCIRAGRAIREARTLLEENGKRKVVPNADLATSVVVFGNALLGPVGIFGERFSPGYDFAIAGEAKIGKTRALVVEARPRPGTPPTKNLYGKAWVDPATGDILRIEWSENRVGHFGFFEERGRLFGRTPRLVISSDFQAEKNGIRFPSRFVVEEAYLKGSGKAFVRSRTEVVYKDFKFFSVEYDVRD